MIAMTTSNSIRVKARVRRIRGSLPGGSSAKDRTMRNAHLAQSAQGGMGRHGSPVVTGQIWLEAHRERWRVCGGTMRLADQITRLFGRGAGFGRGFGQGRVRSPRRVVHVTSRLVLVVGYGGRPRGYPAAADQRAKGQHSRSKSKFGERSTDHKPSGLPGIRMDRPTN